MTGRTTSRRRTGLGALLAATATAVAAMTAACGSPAPAADPAPTEPAAPSIAFDQGLGDRLPVDIRERGSLLVVTDASYPPIESFGADGQTIVGVDPDLAGAIGTLLGVDVIFRNEDFDALLEIVVSGDADLVMSAMTDTVDREEHVDFVNYFAAGTSIVTQRGNPHLITDLESLCGHDVAVEASTTQEKLLERYQSKCEEPMTTLAQPTNDDAMVLLRTGRAVAVLMDYPAAESVTTDPRTHAYYELPTTAQYEPGLYGIGVAKDRTALRDVIRDAVARLIETGVYQEILDHWGVGHGAVTQASINAAGGA